MIKCIYSTIIIFCCSTFSQGTIEINIVNLKFSLCCQQYAAVTSRSQAEHLRQNWPQLSVLSTGTQSGNRGTVMK